MLRFGGSCGEEVSCWPRPTSPRRQRRGGAGADPNHWFNRRLVCRPIIVVGSIRRPRFRCEGPRGTQLRSCAMLLRWRA